MSKRTETMSSSTEFDGPAAATRRDRGSAATRSRSLTRGEGPADSRVARAPTARNASAPPRLGWFEDWLLNHAEEAARRAALYVPPQKRQPISVVDPAPAASRRCSSDLEEDDSPDSP